MVIEAEGKGGGIAWLRYRRKITNIVSYITVKIQMESGNRSGKRMIQRTVSYTHLDVYKRQTAACLCLRFQDKFLKYAADEPALQAT